MKKEPVRDLLAELNSPIQEDIPRIGIVLAAGHGKRIRSETSKMLHEIWGRPTALRVARAVHDDRRRVAAQRWLRDGAVPHFLRDGVGQQRGQLPDHELDARARPAESWQRPIC